MALNLSGHELYVINSNWLFDLTTFTGYRTWKDKHDILVDIKKAYKVTEVVSIDHGSTGYNVTKYMSDIPIGVIRKTYKIIDGYYKRAFVSKLTQQTDNADIIDNAEGDI